MSEKMKNLTIRTLSGIVLAVVMLGAIVWSPWSYGVLFAVLLTAGMLEFYALAAERGAAPQRILGLAAGALLFGLNFIFVAEGIRIGDPQPLLCARALLLLLFPAMFVCELYRKRENPAANIGTTIAGVFYVALPLALVCHFPTFSASGWDPRVTIAYVVIVWANDVFAYLVGMTFGRHKLFERLSPKKSWEGFFGGLLGAAAAGLGAAWWLGAPYGAWAGLALVTAVTAVAGDLAESMFKRSAGVKDSGALIPGHGGVLDRFDAMLLSAPFVFVYMIFVL